MLPDGRIGRRCIEPWLAFVMFEYGGVDQPTTSLSILASFEVRAEIPAGGPWNSRVVVGYRNKARLISPVGFREAVELNPQE